MRSKRDEYFRLVMTPCEKAALARLAENDGSSQAEIVRRLVRREAKQAGLWLDDAALSYRGHSAAELGRPAEDL